MPSLHRLHRAFLGALLALVFVSLAWPATTATAQETGGSIDGGDWSDSSSSSAGDSGDSGGTSSDDSSYDGGSGGSGGSDSGAMIVIAVIVMIGFGIYAYAQEQGRREREAMDALLASGPATTAAADVTMLCVVLDSRVRASVQATLAELATRARPQDADGRARLLAEASLVLRRHRAAWVYGGGVNHPMSSLSEAHDRFVRHASAARSTYQTETVRAADGAVTTAASTAVTRSEEGPGLVLVTLVVAARRELVTVDAPGDGEAMRRAIEAVGCLPPSVLIAVEVIWTPSDPADRMTSPEAERVLASLGCTYAAQAAALVGVAVCAFCGGLYPAEAFSCVHCGGAPRGSKG